MSEHNVRPASTRFGSHCRRRQLRVLTGSGRAVYYDADATAPFPADARHVRQYHVRDVKFVPRSTWTPRSRLRPVRAIFASENNTSDRDVPRPT